eukprot:11258909-Karenia_brevis.AAC.1
MPLALANNLLPLSLSGFPFVIVMSNKTGHALIDFSSINNFDTNLRLKPSWLHGPNVLRRKAAMALGIAKERRPASRL